VRYSLIVAVEKRLGGKIRRIFMWIYP